MSKLFAIQIALLAALLSSCNMSANLEQARKATIKFHERLNVEDYNAIYAYTDDSFQKATSLKEFTTVLTAVHRKLGAVKESSDRGWNLNATTSGTVASMTYATRFEQGSGTESFSWLLGDDAARLVSYNIKSNDLIVK